MDWFAATTYRRVQEEADPGNGRRKRQAKSTEKGFNHRLMESVLADMAAAFPKEDWTSVLKSSPEAQFELHNFVRFPRQHLCIFTLKEE